MSPRLGDLLPDTWDELFRAFDNPGDWLVAWLTDREGRTDDRTRAIAREVFIQMAVALVGLYVVTRDEDLPF